jgi:hypothetical protein
MSGDCFEILVIFGGCKPQGYSDLSLADRMYIYIDESYQQHQKAEVKFILHTDFR